MLIFEPTYYRDFRCIASECPDSCCKEWEVQVDEKSAALYRSLAGPLGERLRAVMRDDPEWGTVMVNEQGRCPMWRQDGLCRIHAELGHDALCKTCRDFPRLCHDYGSFQEFGLELSCPEAARLILTSSDTTMHAYEVDGGEEPDYDEEAMALLLESRKTALKLLYDPRFSVQEALTLLLYYGYQVQAELDGAEAPDFVPEEILTEAARMMSPVAAQPLPEFFLGLEILTEEWKTRLQTPAEPAKWSDVFRNLARYGIERYWLQAVSDYDLTSRVKLIVVSCLLVRQLGGDVVVTAQLYSKEIENNADNVDAILDAAYTHPALTDMALLGMLMDKWR